MWIGKEKDNSTKEEKRANILEGGILGAITPSLLSSERLHGVTWELSKGPATPFGDWQDTSEESFDSVREDH